MPVPLFDTATPLAPLRGEIDAAIARVIDSAKFILGPEVSAFEQEFAAYCGARHAIGVANGTDATTIVAAARCGVRARRRRGRRPRSRSTPAPRRSRRPARGRLLRRRPRDVLRHARDRARPRSRRARKAVDRRPPVRQRRADRRDRGARRAGDRGRRAGRGSSRRAGRPGALGTIATFSFFPSKNLGVVRRRRRDHDRATTRSPTACRHAALPRLRDKVAYEHVVGYNSRLDELQAAILRVQLPHLDAGRHASAPRGGRHDTRRRRPRRARSALPGAGARRRAPAWHLYVAPQRRARRARRGARGRRPRAEGVLPHAGARAAGDARVRGARASCRRPPRSARTHLAIPMSPVLGAEQAAEVTETVRALDLAAR